MNSKKDAKSKELMTVLTPTYNREHTLEKAYMSLVKQINKNFEWLVIDDGSSDNTKELINKFIKEKKIDIKYFYKDNGGKHTALNYGTNKANGDLILILDSDDYLSEDAIELVFKYWKKYKDNKKICGMTFLRKLKNPFYKDKLFEETISNMIDFKYNNGMLADMCEVMRTDVLKKYPYPVFEKERFLSEVIVTGEIAKTYDTAYIPKEIYYTEYLEDGLSLNWFKLVVNNPLGARANNQLFMSKEFNFSIRLKNCIMFNVFSIIAKKPAIKETKMKFWSTIFYIPSYVVAKYLIIKFKK